VRCRSKSFQDSASEGSEPIRSTDPCESHGLASYFAGPKIAISTRPRLMRPGSQKAVRRFPAARHDTHTRRAGRRSAREDIHGVGTNLLTRNRSRGRFSFSANLPALQPERRWSSSPKMMKTYQGWQDSLGSGFGFAEGETPQKQARGQKMHNGLACAGKENREPLP